MAPIRSFLSDLLVPQFFAKITQDFDIFHKIAGPRACGAMEKEVLFQMILKSFYVLYFLINIFVKVTLMSPSLGHFKIPT